MNWHSALVDEFKLHNYTLTASNIQAEYDRFAQSQNQT
jgi:hypothetical protein